MGKIPLLRRNVENCVFDKILKYKMQGSNMKATLLRLLPGLKRQQTHVETQNRP